LAALCAALTLCFASTSQAEIKRLPTEAFVKENQYRNPQLSPDGKHIAVQVKIMKSGHPTHTIAFYTLPELKLVKMIFMAKYEVPVKYRWVSNTRVVFENGKEFGSRQAPESTANSCPQISMVVASNICLVIA